MGALLDKMRDLLGSFSGSQAKILMLGLDAAGKSTVLYKLKLNEVVSTIPTIGFNVETVQPTKHVSFTVWDVGGQDKIRVLWKHYYTNTDGLVFVVDSVDHTRFQEAREELEGVLRSEEMNGVPVLIMANKQDMPNARTPADIASKLGLHELKDHRWHIQATSALSGSGVYEAMEQLSTLVKHFQKSKRNHSITL